MKLGWWVCAEWHVFEYGAESWHLDHMQGFVEDCPVPAFCTEDFPNGEPCMDSTHLWGPFANEGVARLFAILRKTGSDIKVDFDKPDVDPLRASRKLYSVNQERRILNSFRSGLIDKHPEILE